MLTKVSIFQHCEDHILNIPDALYSLKDIEALLYDNHSAIFYKNLEQALENIEFRTNLPCLVYIRSGYEAITTFDNDVFELTPGDTVFLPKGLNLISDYTGEKGKLQAFLVFFGDNIISEFLSTGVNVARPISNHGAIHKIPASAVVRSYFESFMQNYKSYKNSPALLKIKLLELLNIIDVQDPDKHLRVSLSAIPIGTPKRNIKRLVESYTYTDLSVKDFAALSGRSISSFNRDFKSLFNMSPKQWLIEKRLERARSLLVDHQISVTQIANEVGYENISHFITAFKKKYGLTPHQFKKSN
jgi:AraC-like DNA-binding protein